LGGLGWLFCGGFLFFGLYILVGLVERLLAFVCGFLVLVFGWGFWWIIFVLFGGWGSLGRFVFFGVAEWVFVLFFWLRFVL
jgi:hypothetical protein